MSEQAAFVDKLLYHPKDDIASDVLFLCHEPIKWDLEEMQRHLQGPHFTGQPQKVYIFFRWFEVYFCELIRLSHARTQRLLQLLQLQHSLSLSLPLSCSPDRDGPSEEEAAQEKDDEALQKMSSLPKDQVQLVENEMREAGSIMRSILILKKTLLKAQPDDRPNFAEELRVKVEELGVVLRRCMTVEESSLAPWLRDVVPAREARAAVDGELQGDTPPMGWLGLSMWLPWVLHAQERWRSPKEVMEFRERIPWMVSNLSQYLWEPLYLSTNWALLQSMADPLDGEDDNDTTAEYDDRL